MTTDFAGTDWTVRLDGDQMAVNFSGTLLTLAGGELMNVDARRSWFRWFLVVKRERIVRLRGMTTVQVGALRRSIRRAEVYGRLSQAVDWNGWFEGVGALAEREQRWVPRERIDELSAAKPAPGLFEMLRNLALEDELSTGQLAAAKALELNVADVFSTLNEKVLAAELRDRRAFFDQVEKSPLTDEQAKAVVCFDNRVQLLAAAGSGKTSVMVARAAYAVSRRFVSPDRVLLLAFNRAAAAELQERVDARFAAAGIPSDGVRAATFHSFGLDVIGRATGKKPRLAPWLDAGRDTEEIERIADELRDGDLTFRYKWDLYRLLFASAPTAVTGGTPDGYERSTRKTGFRTFRGEVVRSAGERMIADWLFLNGVDYRYEHPYRFDAADETHSQYRPDFYYPDADVWHEHWAIGHDGMPPAEFHGYADSMQWKRRLHAQHGTTLVESAWADVVFGDGLRKLEADLASHGLEFDWNPDRKLPSDVKPLQHADLARLVRTFMAHVKSNSLTEADLGARLSGARVALAGFRTRLFLDIYWPIHREWDRRLRAGDFVDFEDMLAVAADHLEAGRADMGYELILVDEFQDASQARARVVRGLLSKPGRYLLAVGDDWQSINRFAGADISVMQQFEEWFGVGPQLALTRTFRCPQTICDVASSFVTKNPRQFKKAVRSVQSGGAKVTLIQADDAASAVRAYLQRLSRDIKDGRFDVDPDSTMTVDILGRYGFDRDLVPNKPPTNLRVSFRTAHGSKGLEADFIVIPRATSGRYGFPSEIVDDPVLDLAMAAPDPFPNAEERRLFYVALTRARRQATIVTERGRESAFTVELLKEGLITPVGDDGLPKAEVQLCPTCGQGTMVLRSSPYGDFLGCSRFPACRGKQNLR